MGAKWAGYSRLPKPAEEPVEVRVARLSDVEARAIHWLWPGRVPAGKVTLLVGDPGRGKSLMALDMAARVTTGALWPDEELSRSELGACEARPAGVHPRGSVILLTAEDDAGDTVRPRLEAAGGDPSRVLVLRAVKRAGAEGDQMFSLAHDVEVLAACIRELGDVRLVVLDPVSAYLGGAAANSNADVRHALAPVRELAERTRVAVVAISHLTKKSDAAAMYRAMGSLAFVAAARAVWAVGPDRQAAGRLLFLPLKCNLAGGVTGLAYRIVPSAAAPDVPVLAWEPGPVTVWAEDALDARLTAATRRERAGLWLEEVLAGGPVPAAEVEARAKAAGIALITLRRAKRELGVVAARSVFGGAYLWRLSAEESRPVEAEVRAAEPPGAAAPGLV
ncbi:MAG TPA: AAA family ATPase [Planctomycetota bacterium]|nr:AAA family ATPase [Planctomycetota bacterium]HRR81461.1 AAA family ATPase [Planctomycetota bacterium]HRT93534.1 AAA family ATPase [Planctomycetota bacterium]